MEIHTVMALFSTSFTRCVENHCHIYAKMDIVFEKVVRQRYVFFNYSICYCCNNNNDIELINDEPKKEINNTEVEEIENIEE